MTSVEQYPEENQKQFIHSLEMSVGGPAANAACLLAQWGVQTYLLGQLGSDQFSEIALTDLHRCGVHTDYLKRYSGPCNCAIAVSSEKNGSRTVLSQNASREYPITKFPETFAADGLLLDGHQYEWSRQLLKHHRGISVLDAGSFRRETHSLLNQTTDPVTSAPFFQALTRRLSEDETIDMQYQNKMVVTNGEHPVIVYTPGGRKQYPVYQVNAVDTLAAGDCFHGAYLFGRLHQLNTEQSITLASAAAAICVTRKGGNRSLPSYKDVLDFLSSQNDRQSNDVMEKLPPFPQLEISGKKTA